MTADNRITHGEFFDLFGGEAPMEAMQVLFEKDITPDQARERLRNIAAKHSAQTRMDDATVDAYATIYNHLDPNLRALGNLAREVKTTRSTQMVVGELSEEDQRQLARIIGDTAKVLTLETPDRIVPDEVAALLQETGDAIAGMLDQMLKGHWRDQHGHFVKDNVKMIELGQALLNMTQFRSDHMGYTLPEVFRSEYSGPGSDHPAGPRPGTYKNGRRVV